MDKTHFDFRAPEGAPLGNYFVDDSFTSLERGKKDAFEVRVTDPAANYGIKVIGLSPEIRAVQMYAPPAKNFVAIEPQYNLSDPFDRKVWGNQETGIVYLKPGESTTWHVQFVIYALQVELDGYCVKTGLPIGQARFLHLGFAYVAQRVTSWIRRL